MATFLLFPLLFTEAITEIYGDAVGTCLKIAFTEQEPGAAPPRPLKTSTLYSSLVPHVSSPASFYPIPPAFISSMHVFAYF
jgi:hypothetical protein